MVSDSRPTLTLDLTWTDGNVYKVIVLAMQLLRGEPLERFREAITEATQPTAGKRYQDILAIVTSYARLIDRSGLYPEYAWDETAITAAVKRFNEQLGTLPDTLTCAVQEVYPEFDLPELSPVRYLAMVEEELAEVDEQIEMTEEGQQEPFQRLRSMLQECISAL